MEFEGRRDGGLRSQDSCTFDCKNLTESIPEMRPLSI